MARDGSGVKPASKSSIEITFQYQGQRCRERIKLEPTEENLKRAELHKQQIELAIKDGAFDYATTFPNSKRAKTESLKLSNATQLSNYLSHWLTQKKKELHSSTWDGYRKIINHQIIPALGHIPLDQLSRSDVRDWITQLNISNKTVINKLSPLRTALDDAVMDGLIDINPLVGWKWRNRKQTRSKPDTDPFNKEEQQAIIAAATGQMRNLIIVLLWTGMRPSEAIALDWEDVDLEVGTIDINKGITQAAEEAEDTKTGSSKRVLKLLKPALDAFVEQHGFTGENGAEVFQCPRTGKRWKGDQSIRKHCITVMKRAKVRYRKPYNFRHSFASMAISSGENARWLSSYLGHSDLNTTHRVYAHWLSDADPDAGMRTVERYGIERDKDAL